MIIQSKKVWFADQFVEAQIEVKDGKEVEKDYKFDVSGGAYTIKLVNEDRPF